MNAYVRTLLIGSYVWYTGEGLLGPLSATALIGGAIVASAGFTPLFMTMGIIQTVAIIVQMSVFRVSAARGVNNHVSNH